VKEVIVVGDGDQRRLPSSDYKRTRKRGWFDDEATATAGVSGAGRRRHVLRGDTRYDIKNAIHEQDPTVDIVVKDATVRGRRAPTSIANGMHHLDRSADVDAIIVGRGGGSDSNRQAFNTERVAEAIFTANTRWSPRLDTPILDC